MKQPIPRPKQLCYTGGTVPAVFAATEYDPVFTPAVEVFRHYAHRLFGAGCEASGALILVLEPGMGDGYRISVQEQTVLTASGSTGMNYAFATLLQLAVDTGAGVVFPRCEITDRPDNAWRGIMLDLARCYHEIEYLFAVADLCWFYKISRFQLHLSDDQGVRFPFLTMPDAVSEQHYSKEALAGLLRYCRHRGITVVPEIDAPGHFSAFNAAYPQLFGPVSAASNAETTMQADTVCGIMRMQEESFGALQRMLQEVVNFFADSPWIHIGGDEADIAQWETCPVSLDYRRAHGLRDVHELYGHCVARISQMILDMGRIPVVWEGFSEACNHMIPKKALVFAWESYYQTAPSLLQGGFEIINASWLPLYIVSPGRMWPPEQILEWEKNVWQHWWEKSAAQAAPIVVSETAAIAGGQLCVWGDRMQPARAYGPRHDMLRDEFSHLRVRLPALAEKVWTSYRTPDREAFMKDLALHDAAMDKLLP